MASLDLLSIFVSSLLFIFVLFSVFLKWNPYGLPWNWPILGMIPSAIRHIHRGHARITEILQATGCTFYFKGIWFTNTDILFTVDPANIQYIMTTNFQKYLKGPEFKYNFDILGDAIFTSDSDSWKSQRRVAQSLIGHEKFHHFIAGATMEKVEKALIPVLDLFSKKSTVVDLKDFFLRLAFDSTCMMVTGFDLHSLSIEYPEIPFLKAIDYAQEMIALRHFYPKIYWELLKKLDIGEAKGMRKATEIIDEVIANLMAVKIERLKRARELNEDPHAGGADLITGYMMNEEEDELNRNNKYLRDTVLSFMVAGRDGFSVTLSWFFTILSKNPTVLAKLREELKRGALTETLRLYPPVAFEYRSPAEADTLPSGHLVNPNVKIVFPLYSMGRMSSIWGQDCEEFKPERWISEKGKVIREPSYKFFSFNAGPRSCLGRALSFSYMKVIAAAIIHNYDIQPLQHHTFVSPSPSVSVSLHMDTGFKVTVSRRYAHE